MYSLSGTLNIHLLSTLTHSLSDTPYPPLFPPLTHSLSGTPYLQLFPTLTLSLNGTYYTLLHKVTLAPYIYPMWRLSISTWSPCPPILRRWNCMFVKSMCHSPCQPKVHVHLYYVDKIVCLYTHCDKVQANLKSMSTLSPCQPKIQVHLYYVDKIVCL